MSKADTALQGDMRQLTLEEEVQQRCEERSPSEAMEDPALGAYETPRTARPFRVQLWGWKGHSPAWEADVHCAASDQASGGEETALALVRECPALWSHLGVFPT